jgi:hypothetical protein
MFASTPTHVRTLCSVWTSLTLACRVRFDDGLEADDPRHLLVPCDETLLQCYPVSTRVNMPKNDAPDLIAPARGDASCDSAPFLLQ